VRAKFGRQLQRIDEREAIIRRAEDDVIAEANASAQAEASHAATVATRAAEEASLRKVGKAAQKDLALASELASLLEEAAAAATDAPQQPQDAHGSEGPEKGGGVASLREAASAADAAAVACGAEAVEARARLEALQTAGEEATARLPLVRACVDSWC